MTSKSTRKKTNKKDSQLLIRINGAERDAFVELCEQLDTTAAREVRRFIRKFMEKHSASSADDEASL
ncbi:hypothetical protein ACMZOO_03565 [Catenovulum sp. SX2]|uniref:hypothetical protein n=1 Tax=Catenovulum TaxID=1172191 RepID=UPI00031B0FC5|nr:hypothetical protein [Catenovulum agarivorans]